MLLKILRKKPWKSCIKHKIETFWKNSKTAQRFQEPKIRSQKRQRYFRSYSFCEDGRENRKYVNFNERNLKNKFANQKCFFFMISPLTQTQISGK
jgi:hypothetical protein